MAATFNTPAVSLFMRPSNMVMSHILQSLQIMTSVAKQADGGVIRFRAPREPEQENVLNFASVTLDSPEAGARLMEKSNSYQLRIPLTSRAARHHAHLLTRGDPSERSIGLADVASLVGLELDMDKLVYPKAASASKCSQMAEIADREACQKSALLPVEDDVFDVSLKLEPTVQANSILPRRALNSRHVERETGITTKQAYVSRYEREELTKALERFQGFSGKIRASSLSYS